MGFFKANKQSKVEVHEIQTSEKYSFSTPFQKMPKGNLSLPLVWDRYEQRGYIPFGADNLYPNYLNQIYFSSPLHGAIIDFKTNASVGGGYDVELKEDTTKKRLELYTFTQRLNLDKMIPYLTKEYVTHERVYFLVDIKGGKGVKFEHVGAEKVRINKEKNIYTISDDWTLGNDLKTYPVYHKKCKDGRYIVAFEDYSLGQDYYTLPQYTSAMNFAFLSGELSYLAKSNIQNSVFPSFAMKFPKKPQNDEELENIKDTVNKMKGAENAGKAVAFFANSKEHLPELEAIPHNTNDQLFTEASGLITEQICFAHTIDPILLGVRTTGSLGNGSDIKQAYIIFEKNVIIPIRERMQDIFETLMKIAGVEAQVVITNYQIINETITEVEENETVKTLMSLPEDIRSVVLANMSTEQILALGGIVSESVEPNTNEI